MATRSKNQKSADARWLDFLNQQKALLAELDLQNKADFALAITTLLRMGMSQAKLATKLKVSPSAIYRWRSNDRLPSSLAREGIAFRLSYIADEIIAEAAAS